MSEVAGSGSVADAVAAAVASPVTEPAVPAGAAEQAPQSALVDQRVGEVPEPIATVPAGAAAPPVVAGELVEYCLPDGYSLGEWRPALLIKEWQPGYWSLAVFADGGNDGLPCPWWVPTVLYGDGPGHWRLAHSG